MSITYKLRRQLADKPKKLEDEERRLSSKKDVRI